MNKQDEEKARESALEEIVFDPNEPHFIEEQKEYDRLLYIQGYIEGCEYKAKEIYQKALEYLYKHNCAIGATLGVEKAKPYLVDVEEFKGVIMCNEKSKFDE